MNKGLQIRNKKLLKKAAKRNTITSEQKDLCRFIELKWQTIELVNNKYRCIGEMRGKGLQVKNKVYFSKEKYKFVNNHSVKILKTYSDIPQWASLELIEKYNVEKCKNKKM